MMTDTYMDDMGLRPLGDNVLVEPEAAPEQTTTGIYMPAGMKPDGNAAWAVVIGAGPEAEGVSPGDRVLHHRSNGTPMERDGRKLLVIRCRDLMAVG